MRKIVVPDPPGAAACVPAAATSSACAGVVAPPGARSRTPRAIRSTRRRGGIARSPLRRQRRNKLTLAIVSDVFDRAAAFLDIAPPHATIWYLHNIHRPAPVLQSRCGWGDPNRLAGCAERDGKSPYDRQSHFPI